METDQGSPPDQSLLATLTSETQVTLYPLAIREEDEQYIVGRIETGDFVALPEVGIKAVKLLQRGYSLGEAQAQLQIEYDAEVDIDAFVASLIELGFVKALDGHQLDLDQPPKPNLAWLQPHHVRWLFSWPMKITYAALLLAGGVALITHRELIPQHQDFFWSSLTSLALSVNTAMFLAILVLHELSHLVAARALGVPARIGLGTRLNNLVAQTDVTGLWAVPRQQRYRVYLAGMAWDLLVVALALVLLAYVPLPLLTQGLLQALVLGLFLGVLWQLQCFMRTDVYFVVMDLLHCHNLFEDSLAYLRYFAKRLWTGIFSTASAAVPTHPLEPLPAHERQKVPLYTWFVLVGSIASLSVFALYSLPIAIELLVQAGTSVWKGITLSQPWPLLDGVVTLLIQGLFQLAFVLVFLRTHRGLLSALRQAITRLKGLLVVTT